MEKNGKNGTFFYKERKRTERMEHSFIKNGKERKERNVLLKRTNAQPCYFAPSALRVWPNLQIFLEFHTLKYTYLIVRNVPNFKNHKKGCITWFPSEKKIILSVIGQKSPKLSNYWQIKKTWSYLTLIG